MVGFVHQTSKRRLRDAQSNINASKRANEIRRSNAVGERLGLGAQAPASGQSDLHVGFASHLMHLTLSIL